MISRSVRKEMLYGTQARRERSVANHVPYTRHVDDKVLRTKDGLLLSIIKLEGFCFETADMVQINAKLEGRNTILRSQPVCSLWPHAQTAFYTGFRGQFSQWVRRRIEPALHGAAARAPHVHQ
ncbi:hypothetical protein PMI41_02769 [Phyllobacterium sp. YR531]|nr:hypothetical protein PMI41_02769 [Phyllobacterium sp. YR531]